MSEGSGGLAGQLLARLPWSPDSYPQKIDPIGLGVLLVEMSAEAYRAASFLDDRLLGSAAKGAWLPIDRVAEASRSAGNARPLHFIFHTGHVGSTLVSRLLDETGVVLPLREPLPLRTLADAHDVLRRADSLLSEAQFDAILEMFARLWARGYAATRGVVVKATSTAGRLADRVMKRMHDGSRAIYMNVRSEPYLATLLAGENSPLDLRGHAPERMRRLLARVSVPLSALHAMSLGELAAMSWLVESWTQRDAVAHFPERVIALDFEAFLGALEESMRRVLGHFGLPVEERYLSGLGGSATLTRYSKAPEYAYTPALRAEVLRESRRGNREEIRKGLSWLERLAKSDAGVAQIVNG